MSSPDQQEKRKRWVVGDENIPVLDQEDRWEEIEVTTPDGKAFTKLVRRNEPPKAPDPHPGKTGTGKGDPNLDSWDTGI